MSQAIADQLFLAYMGRAADTQWRSSTASLVTAQNGNPSTALQQAFYKQAVAEGVFSASDSPSALVNKIFIQTFGFAASSFEQTAWGNLITNGTMSVETAAWTIFKSYLGATNVPDMYKLPVQSKLVAMNAFSNALTDPDTNAAYSQINSDAASSGRTWLSGVTSQATAYTSIVGVAETVASLIPYISQTFTLTESLDQLQHARIGDKNDLFLGRVAATMTQATTSTYNPGDAIDGGAGDNTLRLFMEDGTTADGVEVENIQNLDLRLTAIGTGGTEVFMTEWDASLESIDITSSRSNVAIVDQQTLADVSITDRSTADLASSYDLGYAVGVLDGNADELNLTVNNVNGVQGADLILDAGLESLKIVVADRLGDEYASEINLNAGEDLQGITVTGGRAGQLFTLDAGDGNDLLEGGTFDSTGFAGDMELQTSRIQTATFGAGSDEVNLEGFGDTSESSYDLGAGNNYFYVDSNLAGSVVAAGGNDIVNVIGNAVAGSDISLGGGNDMVSVYGDHSGIIDVGSGNNTVDILGSVVDGDITAGDGNDSVTISGSLQAQVAGSVVLGNGNNSLRIGSDIVNDIVSFGSGNDVLAVSDDVLGGVVTLGLGANIVSVGGDIGDYTDDATPNVASSFTFGDGNNTLGVGFARSAAGMWSFTTGDDIGGNSQVTFGNGNNTVVVQNDIEEDAALNFGTGNNKVYVGDEISNNASITFAGGNNEIHVLEFYEDSCDDVVPDANASLLALTADDLGGDGDIEGAVDITFSGNGANKLIVASDIDEATITFSGTGANLVEVGNDVEDGATVTFGDGANEMSVGGNIQDGSTVTFGNGANTLDVVENVQDGSTVTFGNGGNTMTVGDNIEGSSITFGSGSDSLSVGSAAADSAIYSDTDESASQINMGAGNDTVTLYSDDGEGTIVTSGASVDGGAGTGDALTMISADSEGQLIQLINRTDVQEFSLTLDQTYTIGQVVSITVGTQTVSYTVIAADFTQGITQDEVRENVAAKLAAAADTALPANITVTVIDNVIDFALTEEGADLAVTSSTGTVEIHEYSNASIAGFETINLRAALDSEFSPGNTEIGEIGANFGLISGVTTAINMDSESSVTADSNGPVGANFRDGDEASFYLYNLSREESRLLSIEADEVTAEGDHQAVQIMIGANDEDHAIGDEITVTVGDTEVVYTVTAADLSGATADEDAAKIARSLETAITAAAAAAGFTITVGTSNTITLIGSTHEDVAFVLDSGGSNDEIQDLLLSSADDDTDSDVYVSVALDEAVDTANDTLTLDVAGRGNFDMDLDYFQGEEEYGVYENVELNVQDAHSHFIDFVNFDTADSFEQDWTLTLTGGSAGEEIYLDNVVATTIDATEGAADLTIRMVGNNDASLEVSTGSGDDTLLLQDSGNEFALVELDDAVDLGAGYNTLVMDAHNIDNQDELRDLEGDDEFYSGEEASSEFDNAYAFAAPFDSDDDYIRGSNVLRDEDFTTTRNVQQLILGTEGQAEDRFMSFLNGESDQNSSSFSITLDEEANTAGLRDIVYSDNQGGDTVLTVGEGLNDWESGDVIEMVVAGRAVGYMLSEGESDAAIATGLMDALIAEFEGGESGTESGDAILTIDGLGTIERSGNTLDFGAIDDGLVSVQAFEMNGEDSIEYQSVELDARNLEDTVIEFGSAYDASDDLTVTTYADLSDSDVDRLTVLNNTEGASLTVNVRDIDVLDRTIHTDTQDFSSDAFVDNLGSLQQFLDFILFQDSGQEMDNYPNVPVNDPRTDTGEPSDYTDHVSRLLVVGNTASVDTVNVLLTQDLGADVSSDLSFNYPLMRINGESIDAVNVSTDADYEGSGLAAEFVLDVNNDDGEGVELLTFDASGLTGSDDGIAVHIATVYEPFNGADESTLESSAFPLGDFEGDLYLFAPISADRSLVSATNQAEVMLDATGGAGDDFIVGGHYGDTLSGGDGDDVLLGLGGSDELYAGNASVEGSGNILQGDLVTAENQVLQVSFAANYDEGDIITLSLNNDTDDVYTYTVGEDGGETETDESEGADVEDADFSSSNGALIVNALRNDINTNGASSAILFALDDDQWTFSNIDVGEATTVAFTIDGRTLTASGATDQALANSIRDAVNDAADADTAQDFLIATAEVTGDAEEGYDVIITRAGAVSDLSVVSGVSGDLEGGGTVVRTDNGTSLFLVNMAAGVGVDVGVSIDNSEGIADEPQIYTVTSSVNLDGESNADAFFLVIEGQTYEYNPDEVNSATQAAAIETALGGVDVELAYSDDALTITGQLAGDSMPLITQAYVDNGEDGDPAETATIDITPALQAADDQDEPTVTIVQDYFTVYADEDDTLVGGAGLDNFLIVKSGDSLDIEAALDAMDTIEGLQLGANKDVVSFGGFALNVDQIALFTSDISSDSVEGVTPLNLAGDASGGTYHSYFLDASNALEITQVVNSGGATAMSASAPDLAAAVEALFAQNNVFEVSGSAATNAAGLFTYDGDTYLIAVGDDAEGSFGADDYIVQLVGSTGTLNVDNVNLLTSVPV